MLDWTEHCWARIIRASSTLLAVATLNQLSWSWISRPSDMRYKTLVRVMIKTLGVYFLVDALSGLGWPIAALLQPSGFSGRDFAYYSLGSPAIGLLAGLYLFFGGRWVVNRIVPSNRPYCHECGYDLTGAIADEGECPECGTAYRRKQVCAP